VGREPSYHAIYLVLNDTEFFPASLRSIYDHISGATVITSYDRDRWDRVVEPDSPVEALLSRELDPERKVNVIASVEIAESRLRNQAMAFVHPPRKPRRVPPPDRAHPQTADVDYFWIVDADEIYDERSIRNLKEYVRTKRANTYLLRPTSYFRTWNLRVEEPTYYVAVVTPGFWFGELRHRYVTPWVRVFQKLWNLRVLPRDVALRAFNQNWLRDVWDAWTPETRNFHPHVPEQFPFAVHVPTAELPPVIADEDWPAGWIERD
jgi:hypothetical protein